MIMYHLNMCYSLVSKIVHIIKMFQNMLEIRDSVFIIFILPFEYYTWRKYRRCQGNGFWRAAGPILLEEQRSVK